VYLVQGRDSFPCPVSLLPATRGGHKFQKRLSQSDSKHKRLRRVSECLFWQWPDLERRAPSRLEGGFPFKLAEAVLGAPFKQTTPLPFFCVAVFWCILNRDLRLLPWIQTPELK
jgi:hypothetical protein